MNTFTAKRNIDDSSSQTLPCRPESSVLCALFCGDSPNPAHTLAAINQPTDGAAAEMTPKLKFTVRDTRRESRLPRRSAELPASSPPRSIPTNTAAVSSSATWLCSTNGSDCDVSYPRQIEYVSTGVSCEGLKHFTYGAILKYCGGNRHLREERHNRSRAGATHYLTDGHDGV